MLNLFPTAATPMCAARLQGELAWTFDCVRQSVVDMQKSARSTLGLHDSTLHDSQPCVCVSTVGLSIARSRRCDVGFPAWPVPGGLELLNKDLSVNVVVTPYKVQWRP